MPTPPSTGSLRRDIEGLRAIAIGTVLAFHAGLPWFSGGFVGVDIFFVLSGFLITGILAREVSRTGRVRLGAFWARRARRLLPASAVVLAFSTLVAFLWLPVTQRATFGWDIASAALYVVNWRLADRSVDYLAEDVGASPVQHFWSLAVEEQFYLVWPLLILAAALVWRRRPVVAATIALAAVTVSSFVYSVQQSLDEPQSAFFVSTTRVWELGVGALLALAAPRLRRLLPDVALGLLGWAGIGMVVVATFGYDGATTWPGVPALLPVLGAAAAIASGFRPVAWAPGRLLSWAPLVWIGGLSYSLYLWHWPILVAGQSLIEDFRIRDGVALTLLAFVPAWLSHRYVENPVRFGARWRPAGAALRLGAALTVIGVVVGAALPVSARLGGALQEATPSQARGAAALDGRTVWADVDRVDAVSPLPAEAPEDLPAIYERDPECQLPVGGDRVEPLVCRWGPRDASRTVVLTGDSKINQWQSALEEVFRDQDVQLLQITKSACAFTSATTTLEDAPWDGCREWGDRTLELIEDIDPDLVITSQRRGAALPPGGRTEADATADAMVDGLATTWRTLEESGVDVAVLLDNPGPPAGNIVYECVAENPARLSTCSFPKAAAIESSAAPVQRRAAERVTGVDVIDLTDVVCPDEDRCAPVIGDVLVYRQGSHVTNTYAMSAVPQLRRALVRAVPALAP